MFGKKIEAAQNGKDRFGDELNFAASEAYNLLRTSISFLIPGKKTGKIFGITSPCPHEGKSFTAVNLAFAMAKNGMRVLLVDGDLRRSSVAEKLGLPAAPGLSNFLAGSDDDKAPIHTAVLREGFDVLCAGDTPPNPSELLGSERMRDTLNDFSASYDAVIVDLPPVNPVADAMILSPALDGYVVVIRHCVTTRKDLKEAMRHLTISQAKVLGFVYNGYSSSSRGYGYYKKNYSTKKEYDAYYTTKS